MRTIWYSCGGDDGWRHPLKISSVIGTSRKLEQVDVAELCATDFHDHHNGAMWTWPIVIRIYETEHGAPIATLEVDREVRQFFVATHISADQKSL